MSKEQKVGLFFFFGILLVFVLIEVIVGTGLLEKRYHLWAEYRDVHGLNVGDPVRVAGVKKGSVGGIEVTPQQVRVRLEIDRGAPVRRDSVARLDFEALSGSRFIAISLGSPNQPVLQEGDTIQAESPAGLTEMIGQLESVAASVQELAVSLNRNQDELLNNLNRLIVENERSLNATFAHLRSISEKIDQGEGTVARLLNDAALYEQLESLLVQANRVLGDLREVSAQLAAGEGSLGRLVRDEDLYDEVRETVASLNVTAQNLEAISNEVRDGQGTLGRLVVDESLYVEAQDAVRGLDRATANIEDASPISILGTVVSTLF